MVRRASKSDIPDAPSGFRAFSREAALRLNVTNEYTYTLETIVQAGREKIPMEAVPVRTNGELRPSRLFHSMFGYIKKSILTILRTYVMYRPLTFFTVLGCIPFLAGLILGIRFLVFFFQGYSSGHIQSLILASTLLMMGFMTWVVGILSDTIASERKILEDVQYHARRADYQTGGETKEESGGENG